MTSWGPEARAEGAGRRDVGSREILVHVCCAPCLLYPRRALEEEGFAVRAYFYNPNVQPSQEYRRRLQTLRDYAERTGLDLEVSEGYRPEEHLAVTLDRHADRAVRCRACYELRLAEAAREARRRGIGLFTTTLLVSPYQVHREVRWAGDAAAAAAGGSVEFVYRDFRPGWREGVRLSRELGLYRQPYCGCLWSEVERYGRSGL